MADVGTLHPAVFEFLIDGNRQRAIAALRASGQSAVLLWQDDQLAKIWQDHRSAIMQEAKRRGVTIPHGLDYDAYDHRTRTFGAGAAPIGPHEPEPGDDAA